MSEATATTTASDGGSIGPRVPGLDGDGSIGDPGSLAQGPLGPWVPGPGPGPWSLGPVATATMEGLAWDLGQDIHKIEQTLINILKNELIIKKICSDMKI